MLKAINAQESKKAAWEKAKAVAEGLRSMKLQEAAKKVENEIEETLTYCDFLSEHWTRIRTNNVIERLNREIRPSAQTGMPWTSCAVLCTAAPCGRHPVGQQKVHEHEASGGTLEDTSIAG